MAKKIIMPIDLSSEISRLPLSEFRHDSIQAGIVYANSYPVAMASLGYLTILRLAASHDRVSAHRVILDSVDGNHYPTKTLEKKIDIKSLDILLISCSFELDYLHIVRILDEAGIPPLRKNRKSLPLVVIGGVSPSANPEPLANFADAIGIGEGDEMLNEILDDFIQWHPSLLGSGFLSARDELYETWNQRNGVYVPALWEDELGNFQNDSGSRIQQTIVHDLENHISYSPIVTPHGVYGRKNLIEVGRGCPTHCRFCLISFIFKSGRDRSKNKILEGAECFTPHEASVGLVSSSLSDHPEITDTINTLADFGYQVSVSSCKINSTSHDLVNALARAKSKSITFAPEHGSEKIREIIGKLYTYDDVKERAGWAFDAGMTRVKLYFITGFSEESDEIVLETPEFVRSIANDLGLYKKGGRKIICGIAPLVPKAITPFQRRPMLQEKELKRRLKLAEKYFRNDPVVELELESPRASLIQGMLSIGGRELTEHLMFVAKSRGNILRAWEESLKEISDEPLKKILSPRDTGTILPWSFIKRSESAVAV